MTPIDTQLICYQGINGPYNCVAVQHQFPNWFLILSGFLAGIAIGIMALTYLAKKIGH